MATVGALNVILSASSAQFSAGLKRARSDMRSFTRFVTSSTSLIAGALGIGISGFAIKQFIGGQMEAMDVTAKLSDRLGITTESLVGLQHAADLAGVSSEELTNGIEKMLKTLPGGGSTEDAFNAMAEKLMGMSNAFDRAKAVTEVFGKSGQRLLPLLMSGAAGIKAAQQEAERLGLTFSRVDAAKVEAANDAMTRLSAVLTGIGRSIAIEVAPFVEALSNHFIEMGTAGAGASTRVVDSFGWVLKAAAKLADIFELLKAGWHSMAGVAGLALGTILIPISLVIDALSWLGKKLGLTGDGFDNFAAKFEGLQEEIMGRAREQFEKAGESFDVFASGKNSKAAANMFKEIQSGAQLAAEAAAEAAKGLNAIPDAMYESAQKIADIMDDLQKQIDTFGMTAAQVKVFELKALGADAATIAKAEEMVKQLGAMKSLDDFFGGVEGGAALKRGPDMFAAATERRHAFTTPDTSGSKDPTKIAETHLKTTEKALFQETKQSALLNLINQKLASSGSIGVISLN